MIRRKYLVNLVNEVMETQRVTFTEIVPVIISVYRLSRHKHKENFRTLGLRGRPTTIMLQCDILFDNSCSVSLCIFNQLVYFNCL